MQCLPDFGDYGEQVQLRHLGQVKTVKSLRPVLNRQIALLENLETSCTPQYVMATFVLTLEININFSIKLK